MPRLLTTVLIVTAMLGLEGCGQMGPLYMPAEEPPPHESTERADGAAPASEDA